MEWVMDSVRSLTSICLVIAVMDCVTGDEEAAGTFRMICGIAIACTVVRFALRALEF